MNDEKKISSFISEQIGGNIFSEEYTLENKKAYIGFECSGKPHLGWIPLIEIISYLVQKKVIVHILLADTHTELNQKGDIIKIKKSKQFLKKYFKKIFPDIIILESSNLIFKKKYLKLFLNLSEGVNLNRIKKTFSIMGRTEEEANKNFLMWLYPLLQITDILYLDADIILGGTDQRKVHILAKEIFKAKKLKKTQIFIHSILVPGIGSKNRMGQKMSKSIPEDTIYLDDSNTEIQKKIAKCFLSYSDLESPLFQIIKQIVYPLNKKLFGYTLEELFTQQTLRKIDPIKFKLELSIKICSITKEICC